jgi:hypothetical protein
VADEETTEQRSWLPIALALGFVLFSALVAVLVNLRDGDADPDGARTVLDVAELTVTAVEDSDTSLYAALRCDEGEDLLTPYVGGDSTASAKSSAVTGVQTGAFHLAIDGEEKAELDVTVGQDGDRSCIEDVALTEATR